MFQRDERRRTEFFLLFRSITFYTSESKKIHVISGCDDGRIFVHNLHTPSAKPTILQGHMSTVTSLAIHAEHILIRFPAFVHLFN